MAEGRTPAKTVEEVRRLLDRIVKRHPDVHDLAVEIAGMLDGLVSAMTKKPAQRRTGENVEYRVEVVNKRPMLYELRPAGAPLRVSHDLYMALVRVLGPSLRPLSYDEIAEGVEEMTGTKVAEWQGRLLLRFIQRADPPIVVRERSRYRAVDPAKFPAAALKLWRSSERT